MQPDASSFDIVAIAASSGGLSAIAKVISDLPADFPASVLVVQHPSPEHKHYLADILGQYTKMSVK